MDPTNPFVGCYTPEFDFQIDDTENIEMHHHFSQNPPDSPALNVPETQEIPPTRPDGGCGGSRGGGSRLKKSIVRAGSSSQPSEPSQATKWQTTPWEKYEKEALLRAWVQVSEDSIVDMKEDKDSRWFELERVPKAYIFSKEDRPQNIDTPVCDSIPVIDLAKPKAANGDSQRVEEILKASQEFGFFHVTNHGIPEKTLIDAMNVLKEYFDMQPKDKSGIIPPKKSYIYTSSTDYAKDGVYLWRENHKIPCHPLEKCIHLWPDTPTQYQEVIAAYLVEIQKLSARILEMICEGLGLKQGYFKDTSELQLLSSNFYPPCPDPSLTLGILPHIDPSLITLVYQGGTTGLQFMKDGQWVNVGASPNAFVVNIGNQLEIISNGKFRSAKHRVVNSKNDTRLSIATFVNPSPDCIIEPAKHLVNELEPALYTASLYKDYVHRFNAFGDYTGAILGYK